LCITVYKSQSILFTSLLHIARCLLYGSAHVYPVKCYWL
jgi:hypothetical protein